MTRDTSTLYAVLTGDIVDFSKYSPRQRSRMPDILQSSYDQTQNQFRESLLSNIEIFRGDSWQFIIKNAKNSFRIALYYRALFISQMESTIADTRISIGIGTVDYLPTENIITGDGEAFRQSGVGLDTMPRNLRMQICTPINKKSPEVNQINVIVQLVDTLARQWTPRQAFMVCGAISGLTQEKIGGEWVKEKISQQAVAQHLERAGWNAISASIQYYEEEWYPRVENQLMSSQA